MNDRALSDSPPPGYRLSPSAPWTFDAYDIGERREGASREEAARIAREHYDARRSGCNHQQSLVFGLEAELYHADLRCNLCNTYAVSDHARDLYEARRSEGRDEDG